MRFFVVVFLLTVGATGLGWWWVASEIDISGSVEVHPLKRGASKPETTVQQPIALEAVKRDLRRVDGAAPIDRQKQVFIARLPARPVPVQPEPAPKSQAIALPVTLVRPLIEAPGELLAEERIFKLSGIALPTLERKCVADGKTWPCGRMARTAMRRFVRGRTVICIAPPAQDKKPSAAQCTVGGVDIGAWMVGQGWAVADDESDYAPQNKEAQQKRRGLWRGEDGEALSATLSRPTESATADP